ncbi:MAG TPA: hypothetical protein VF193_08330 [Steroidobacter sp.]|jgi:hypothetical protein
MTKPLAAHSSTVGFVEGFQTSRLVATSSFMVVHLVTELLDVEVAAIVSRRTGGRTGWRR